MQQHRHTLIPDVATLPLNQNGQVTLPPRLRAALREQQRLAEQTTLQTPAVRLPSIPPAVQASGRMLPLDQQGRPYLKIVNPYENTLTLVEAAVQRFYELQGCYPVEIILSPFHFLTYGMAFEYFYTRGRQPVRIPFICENNCSYDVLVRGGRPC